MVKLSLCLSNQALRHGGVWGSGCIDPHFLHPLGKSPPLRVRQEARWAPESAWTTWRRENYWPYCDSKFDPSVDQPVASRCTGWAIILIIIIIINIVIGKTDLFEPYPSLEHSARLHLVFTSLDFVTVILLQSKFVSFAFNPQPGGVYVYKTLLCRYSQCRNIGLCVFTPTRPIDLPYN
jgi:hypothetical protein